MDGFVGEIRVFGGNYAPQGWVLCNGQLLTINDYQTLYSLIGTTYGGDSQSTFAVPNLQASVAVGVGQGPQTPGPYVLGQKGGAAAVTLIDATIPGHTHTETAVTNAATSTSPANNLFAAPASPSVGYYANPPTPHDIAASTVSTAGSSQAHNNIMPSLGLTYIIAVAGNYPSFPT